MPANEDFRDFILRRGHMLARYENGVVAEMMVPYNRARQEVYARLLRLEELALTGVSPTRDFMIQRLRGQLSDIDGILQAAALDSAGTLQTSLAELSHLEHDAHVNMLRGSFNKVGININDLPFRQIDFAIQEPLIYQYRGMTIPESMLWTNQEAITAMRTELTQSVIQGEDMRRAANRLVGTGTRLGGTAGALIANKANIIARTEIQHISNEVSRAVYKENQDVLKGVSYVSTLDNRTCILPNVNISTSTGSKKMKDINVGDKVLTHKNRYKEVTGKQKSVRSKYLKVKLSNGEVLKITPDHEVLTKQGWIEIGKLKEGDKICKVRNAQLVVKR